MESILTIFKHFILGYDDDEEASTSIITIIFNDIHIIFIIFIINIIFNDIHIIFITNIIFNDINIIFNVIKTK